MFVVYYVLCYLHIWACIICLTARIDPEPTLENKKGWFNLIGFSTNKHTIYDIYI